MPQPSYPECPRRRAPDERPSQILDAALATFDSCGLAGARLEDIASRAGVAKGTIYLYFANKEELFREVIRQTLIRRLEEATGEIAAAPAGATATDQLRSYAHGWWAFLTTPTYQAVYRLIVSELHRFPELTDFYREEVVSRAHALVSSIIARGVASGEFRPIDPRVASRIMASMFVSHSLWIRRNQLFTGAAHLDAAEVRDQIFDFIVHALRPPDPSAAAGPHHPPATLP